MRKFKKILSIYALLVLTGAGAVAALSSCNSNRYITYEDGMFDTNEVYQDAVDETFQINSEVDNDDQERY